MKEPSFNAFSTALGRTSNDIDHIIGLLKMRSMEVDGPMERNGESIYHINHHTLSEPEIRYLAERNSLTTWEIYSYVKNRSPNRRV
jgi:hypothetical protein